MSVITIKKGLQANVDAATFAIGELALATDTGNVYVGLPGNQKKHINPAKLSEYTNDANFQTADQVSAAIQAIVGTAPEALNTLQELAAALGDDANYAATVTAALAGKEALVKNVAVKETIGDTDTFVIVDLADGSNTKQYTFANMKAALKAYFDTLYGPLNIPTASADTKGGVKVGTGLKMEGEVLSVDVAAVDMDGGTF